jgi:probable O-glycosylation ligase (exosortase A-associated)
MKGPILTWFLTIGGAVVAPVRPFIGLVIYIAFAILRPQAIWEYELPHFAFSRVVTVGLLLGWVMNGMGSWQFGRARGLVIAFFGFAVWTALAAFFHPFPAVGWNQAEANAKIFLPFLVGITLINSVNQLKMIAWVLVVCQAYLAYEFHVFYYSGFFNPDEWVFATLDRNGIAITMCTSIGLAFFLVLHSERWWAKGIALVSAMLMAHVILFSMSRGGMLGLILVGGVTFLLIRKRLIHYLLFFLVVAMVLRLAGPSVRQRFGQTYQTYSATGQVQDESAASRVQQWKLMIESMKDKTLFGVGAQQWRDYTRTLTGSSHDGHSTWLTTGAEMGVPTMLFLLAFYILGLIRLWPIAREKYPVSDPWLYYLSRMVIASVIGFMVSGQFVTCYGVELPYLVMLIGAGVLKLQSLSSPQEARDVKRIVPMRPALLAPARALRNCIPPRGGRVASSRGT